MGDVGNSAPTTYLEHRGVAPSGIFFSWASCLGVWITWKLGRWPVCRGDRPAWDILFFQICAWTVPRLRRVLSPVALKPPGLLLCCLCSFFIYNRCSYVFLISYARLTAQPTLNVVTQWINKSRLKRHTLHSAERSHNFGSQTSNQGLLYLFPSRW